MPTANLNLPLIASSQNQKHVTHNEALRLLDGITQLSVIDRHLTAPPGSPDEGDRYIVASGATGAWDDWDLNVALWVDGAWMRLVPRPGWLAWVEDESQARVWTGSSWQTLASALGFVALGAATLLAEGAGGAEVGAAVAEELLSGLSGAIVDSTITIPDRAIVLGVSTRVVTAITGASSFGCGVAGEATEFGGSLGVSAGSSNRGVIGPTAYYAATPIRLTANGGNFTDGAVRIAIHYLTCAAPD